VYAHAISNPNWEGIHAVARYEARILVCSRKQGKIVFVFSDQPDADYLKYRKKYLGYDKEETIIVTTGKGSHLAERLLNDSATLRKLKKLLPRETILDTFTIGPLEEKLAQALGFKLIGSASNEALGCKSQFRQIAKSADLHVARGFEFLTSINEVISAAQELFKRGAKFIVVKGDYGASSAQNQKFTNEPGWQNKVQEFCERIGFESGVVEEWMEDIVISPSIHFFLNGRVIEQKPGPWEQILKEANKVFAGAKYPADIPKQVAAKIRGQGSILAAAYSKLGLEGPLGFDTVVHGNNNISWIEANARRGGVTFIRDFAEVQDVLHKVVWGLDLKNPRLAKMTFKQLLEKTKPLLYHHAEKEKGGIVFYNVGCMSQSKIQVIIVADTKEEAQYYWTVLNQRLV